MFKKLCFSGALVLVAQVALVAILSSGAGLAKDEEMATVKASVWQTCINEVACPGVCVVPTGCTPTGVPIGGSNGLSVPAPPGTISGDCVPGYSFQSCTLSNPCGTRSNINCVRNVFTWTPLCQANGVVYVGCTTP